jgi:CRISPR-associated protein Cas4
MEVYLPISYINDFIFCPRSIYFHGLYGTADEGLYHTTDQGEGRAAHKTVDMGTYSDSKNALQGISVYSSKYEIGGKIDIFYKADELLVERKKKIKTVYDGYIYQLYAQYYCLTDMGYNVKKIKLYSMDDNKGYPVSLPCENSEMREKFESLISEIKKFDVSATFESNPNKCVRCIYNPLCGDYL